MHVKTTLYICSDLYKYIYRETLNVPCCDNTARSVFLLCSALHAVRSVKRINFVFCGVRRSASLGILPLTLNSASSLRDRLFIAVLINVNAVRGGCFSTPFRWKPLVSSTSSLSCEWRICWGFPRLTAMGYGHADITGYFCIRLR